jgi:hypothetical protein
MTLRYYDLYGTRGISIDELQAAAGAALAISFERRYHDEIGYYHSAEVGEESFTIEPNFLEEGNEEDIQEPELADRPVLLYVSRTERGDEIRDLLLEIPGLEHLRRDTRD